MVCSEYKGNHYNRNFVPIIIVPLQIYVEKRLYIEIYFNEIYWETYLDLFSFSLLFQTFSNPGIFLANALSPAGK